MPAKRIPDLTALTGAASASNDDVVVFDTSESTTKRITRAQLAIGMQADTQTLTNKTINARTNTLQGSDASRLHWFKDVAALLADTALVADTGDVVQTREEGFAYEVAASGASNHHVTTAGGVKLYVLASGSIRVDAFGVFGAPVWQTTPSGLDHTAGLQKAIDFSSANGVEIVLSGEATYFASGLVLKMNTHISGGGRDTIIRPVNDVSHHVLLDEGPVLDVRLRDLRFIGNNITGIHCFYLQARKLSVVPPGDVPHGGLWFSNFERVEIRGYGGAGMWFRGGCIGTVSDPAAAYDFLRPHQWVTLLDCKIQRENGSTWPCLLMTGQTEHIAVIGSSLFDAVAGKTGVNIVISREFNNAGEFGGVDRGGSAVSDIAPIVVTFLNAATQSADTGIWVERSSSVAFREHWFEDLNRGIRVETVARVVVDGCHFANAASDGAGTGYAIRVGSTASVTGRGNQVSGAFDKLVLRASALHVDPGLFAHSSDVANLTTALTAQYGQSGATLSLQATVSSIINGSTSPTPITTLNSGLLPGSFLAFRVLNDAIVLASGGNITNLPNGRLVLRAGDGVVFQRHDTGGTFVLVGLSRTTTSDTIPTSNYYEAGEEVVKRTAPPSSGAFIVGWRRLTTGTAHVLGTDWQLIIRNTAHQRTTNISTTPVAVLALPSTAASLADARLVVVTGTDNTNGSRAFSDLLLVLGTQTPVVVSSVNAATTPAARTYAISGSDLTLAMATGTYSVRALAQVTPTGDVNFNWT